MTGSALLRGPHRQRGKAARGVATWTERDGLGRGLKESGPPDSGLHYQELKVSACLYYLLVIISEREKGLGF